MKATNITLHPMITEKTTGMSQNKIYAFKVSKDVNKNQVKTAVEQMFKVEVSQVRINIRKGKEKKVGRKMIIKQLPDIKIAFVTVNKGTIDLFPQS
jgi:large subunit ribosomal protein L23